MFSFPGLWKGYIEKKKWVKLICPTYPLDLENYKLKKSLKALSIPMKSKTLMSLFDFLKTFFLLFWKFLILSLASEIEYDELFMVTAEDSL